MEENTRLRTTQVQKNEWLQVHSISRHYGLCFFSYSELDLKEVEKNGEVEEAVKNCPVFSMSSLFPLLVLRVIYPCIETISKTHIYWD